MGGIPKQNTFKRSSINKKGFTLVEVLVSATLIILCTIAIVAMLRKGREIDINDRHRRFARAIIAAEFETPKFHYSNYSGLPSLIINPYKVTLDERGTTDTGDDLLGTVTIDIAPQDDATYSTIPFIKVTITVEWPKGNQKDDITLHKYITGAQ